MTGSLITTDYSQQSDADLISACRRGEEKAWYVLVGRYERLVYTIPARHGLSQKELSEVFQAVWLSLLNNLKTLGHPERVAAWLVTETRREWRKKREKNDTNSLGAAEWREGDRIDEPTPDEVVATYRLHETIRRAMNHLDSSCRRLLSLLYKESAELSFTEVATELSLPVRVIGPLRAQCLSKLRRIQATFGQ
jgi:RNA polymerase sigma factor (sigma-70 family)